KQFLDTLIKLYLQQLSYDFAVCCYQYLITARQSEWTTLAEFGPGLARKLVGTFISQIPRETVHTCLGGNLFLRRFLVGPLRRSFGFLLLHTGKLADDSIL